MNDFDKNRDRYFDKLLDDHLDKGRWRKTVTKEFELELDVKFESKDYRVCVLVDASCDGVDIEIDEDSFFLLWAHSYDDDRDETDNLDKILKVAKKKILNNVDQFFSDYSEWFED